MKKFILLFTGLIFIITSYSQEIAGFAMGPNLSTRLENDYKSHIGYQAFGYVNFGTYKKAVCQVQLKVQQTGYWPDEQTMALNYYASVPVLLKIKQKKSNVSVLLGFEPNFFIVGDFIPVVTYSNTSLNPSDTPIHRKISLFNLFQGNWSHTESSDKYSYQEDFVGVDFTLGILISKEFQQYLMLNFGLTNNNLVLSYSIGI